MRFFSRINVKRTISVILIFSMLAFTEMYLGGALEKVNFGYYFKHEISKVYNDKQDIDILFIGTSRIYRGFDPEVLEDKMNMNCVFVSGAASATNLGIYYLLKDITESCKVHRVFIGVSFDDLTRSEYSQDITQANLLILDRLNKLRNKLGIIWNGLNNSDKLYALNLYRYRNDLNGIKKEIQNKKKAEINEYHGDMEKDDYYRNHGFVYSRISTQTGNMAILEKDQIDEERIIGLNAHYLDRSVSLCKKAGIQVDLVTCPISDMLLYNIDNYQTASDYFKKYAESKGINYYDLNLLKDREKNLPDEMFKDAFHLNGQGASYVSDVFASILNDEKNNKNISEYFYENIDQFKESVNRVVAVKADLNYDYFSGSLDISLDSLRNEGVIPVYRVEFKYFDSDDYVIIQDWSTTSKLHMELGEMSHGELKVRCRLDECDKQEAFQKYTF